jgi:hypothetical protein
MRYNTLRDLDRADLDLRIWCYRCERAVVLPTDGWPDRLVRGEPIGLGYLWRHFRCKNDMGDGTVPEHAILLVPARREVITAERLVAAWFHGSRAAAKKRRNTQ